MHLFSRQKCKLTWKLNVLAWWYVYESFQGTQSEKDLSCIDSMELIVLSFEELIVTTCLLVQHKDHNK